MTEETVIKDCKIDEVTELIKSADVLVWGYHYPALERLGFSLETLQALNPNLAATKCRQ